MARRLLHYPDVVSGELGQELAAYLLEFLPYEAQQKDIVEAVQLCLQGDLTTEKQRADLWKRAKRKNPYYVGFVHSKQNIPLDKSAHPEESALNRSLADLIAAKNPYALQLCELLSADGQKWLYALKESLRKPVDQDVIIALFIFIDRNLSLPFPERRGVRDIQFACDRSDQLCSDEARENEGGCPPELVQVISAIAKDHLPLLNAMLMLAQLGEDTLIPIFAGNDSGGSVMRRKLEPLTTPILERVDVLMHPLS